jgi:hypothetical protein
MQFCYEEHGIADVPACKKTEMQALPAKWKNTGCPVETAVRAI